MTRLLASRRALAVLVLSLAVLLILPCAFAQETTAGITGTVKDPSGAVITKATVEVTSPALIGVKKIQSDDRGYYRFANLPPGDYTITVAAQGFKTYKQAGISLEVGKLPTIDITMQVGGGAETVEVTGAAPIVDVTQSKVAVSVPEEVIQNIPKTRSFQSLIAMAPGARQEPLQSSSRTANGNSTAGGFSIDGASDSENSYLVEGMDTTAVYGGGIGQNVPMEFVQEVQIKSSGFEAEFGGALGGVVNVIQKRGSNAWHGSVYTYFRTNALNASDPCIYFTSCGQRYQAGVSYNSAQRLAAPVEYYKPAMDHRRWVDPGFELGGYLFKDKLWVFSSYSPTIDRLTRTVNFINQANAANNGPRSFAQRVDVHNALNRLDYALTDKVRLFGAWQYGYERDMGTSLPNPDSAKGQTNLSATVDPTTYRQDRGTVYPDNVWTFGGDVSITPKLVATARYGYWFNNAEVRGTPVGIRYVYTATLGATANDLTGVPIAGGPAAAYVNQNGWQNIASNVKQQFNAFKRKTLTTDFSYFASKMGTHNLKFGYARTKVTNDVLSGPDSALVNIYWLQPYSVTNPGACNSIISANPASMGGVCAGRYGYYTVSDYETGGHAAGNNSAVYAQDAWTVGKGVTLNLGVRFDKEYLPPYSKGAPDISFGFTDKIAPRIGGAWDVKGDGKMKVYGSFGLFYDIMKYSLPGGSFGGEYWHDCTYALDDPNFNGILPSPVNGHACGPSGGSAGTMPGRFIENVNFRSVILDPSNPGVDPNIKPMRQHEYMAGTDYAITPMLGLEVRYNRKRLDKTIEDVGIITQGNELYFIGNPGFGIVSNLLQRPVTDSSSLPSTTYPAVCPSCPLSPKAYRDYDGLEIRLTKRPSQRWYGSLSYTYSRLYGNYSGLTSSDANDTNSANPGAGGGRHNPNNNRSFDLPNMQFTAHGQPQFGPLGTDRPHTLKAVAYYRLKWFHEETNFGFQQAIYSGTPISTCWPEVNTQSACSFVENRGNFVELHRDPATGNIVSDGVIKGYRTPVYTQTDLNLRHEIKVSKTNEALRLGFEMNVFNLFNQHAILSYMNTPLANGNQWITPVIPGTNTTDWLAMTKTGVDYIAASNGVNSATGAKGLDSRYGLPNLYQPARTIRLGVKFTF